MHSVFMIRVSFSFSLIHPLNRSSMHSFIHVFIHAFVYHSFNNPLVRPLMRSFNSRVHLLSSKTSSLGEVNIANS